MTKNKKIILAIVVLSVVVAAYYYFYLYQPSAQAASQQSGINPNNLPLVITSVGYGCKPGDTQAGTGPWNTLTSAQQLAAINALISNNTLDTTNQLAQGGPDYMRTLFLGQLWITYAGISACPGAQDTQVVITYNLGGVVSSKTYNWGDVILLP
jgi:hypothetical protein